MYDLLPVQPHQSIYSLALSVGHQMAVRIQRNRDRRVPQALTHDLSRWPRLRVGGSRACDGVVLTNLRESAFGNQSIIEHPAHAIWVHERNDLHLRVDLREHVLGITAPREPKGESSLDFCNPVSPQDADRFRVQDVGQRLTRLRRREVRLVTHQNLREGWETEQVSNEPLPSLFYIAHQDNLASILEHGILSHDQVDAKGLRHHRVDDAGIVERRRTRQTEDRRSLTSYANLYFQPRNPMMFRIKNEVDPAELVVLRIDASVVDLPGVHLTDGNAASSGTSIVPRKDVRRVRREINAASKMEWWTEADGSKRRIMCEALVPDRVPPEYITNLYVPRQSKVDAVSELSKRRKVICDPDPFFEPRNFAWLGKGSGYNLTIVRGDMFLSRMQTLTISVNTVGVMGKGLASRAKYQFPDVYVKYQDACRKKTLEMGKPFLYERESPLWDALEDDASADEQGAWFLLFATKSHWREDADLPGIERGLDWVVKNYKKKGIRSLALPALGCGLGNLSWETIGPLMCRRLVALDIPVEIYAPEGTIPAEQVTPDFLLGEATTGVYSSSLF